MKTCQGISVLCYTNLYKETLDFFPSICTYANIVMYHPFVVSGHLLVSGSCHFIKFSICFINFLQSQLSLLMIWYLEMLSCSRYTSFLHSTHNIFVSFIKSRRCSPTIAMFIAQMFLILNPPIFLDQYKSLGATRSTLLLSSLLPQRHDLYFI